MRRLSVSLHRKSNADILIVFLSDGGRTVALNADYALSSLRRLYNLCQNRIRMAANSHLICCIKHLKTLLWVNRTAMLCICLDFPPTKSYFGFKIIKNNWEGSQGRPSEKQCWHLDYFLSDGGRTGALNAECALSSLRRLYNLCQNTIRMAANSHLRFCTKHLKTLLLVNLTAMLYICLDFPPTKSWWFGLKIFNFINFTCTPSRINRYAVHCQLWFLHPSVTYVRSYPNTSKSDQ